MSRGAIEINDAGVLVAVDGVVRQSSPGYALLDREPTVVGEPALHAARIEPLNINNRFWNELDERPLLVRAAAGRSHADLAYLHLAHIWRDLAEPPQAVRFAVPATLRPQQLALLLGIAREARVPVAGFVDTAVALASTAPDSGRLLYVDVHLHHTVITAVAVGERARRERSELARNAGWLAFTDTWLSMVGREFVARTRFDPLHRAAVEQQLFDALPGWLEQLQTSDAIEIELPFEGETHSVRLTREQFALEADGLYTELLMRVHRLRTPGHATTIVLGDRAALLPGLAQRFAEFNDCNVVRSSPGAAVIAAAALDGEATGDDTVQLLCATPRLDAGITRLPWKSLQDARPADVVAAPSHLLYRGQAVALGPEPLHIGLAPPRDRGPALSVVGAAAGVSRLHCSVLRLPSGAVVVDHSRYGTWLNDERVFGRATLRAGDRLRLGRPGVTLELITSG
ncbi:MAG TPA: FHA domain-containing protein [Steroidobacteraceae bacterium]|nr:FHA domain-containing protein [Steroidobacteraceae bacterium]